MNTQQQPILVVRDAETAAMVKCFVADRRFYQPVASAELADSVHEQRLPMRGELFCYFGNATERRARFIARTGCHENHGCIPPEQMRTQQASINTLSELAEYRDTRGGFLEFVTTWLNKHIHEENMQYSSHVCSHLAAAA